MLAQVQRTLDHIRPVDQAAMAEMQFRLNYVRRGE